MRNKLFLAAIFIGHVCFSQQFNNLDIERKNVDSNNSIYKTGVAVVYDYEIIENGYNYKLNYNEGLPENKFELVKDEKDTLELKIHLLIPKVEKKERTNKNQTEIYYIFEPTFSFISQTGIVENNSNVWIHPPRSGFFAALETCPYPYVKLPIKIGKEWNDKMKIGDHWCNKKWGVWSKKLLLSYDYKITQKTKVKTDLGELDCFVIESTAKSEIGQSKLTSYFSEKYGFVRLDYELFTGIKVNLWIENYRDNNNLNGLPNVAKYIDKQRKTVANNIYTK